MKRFAITSIGVDGLRTLTFANQGKNFYSTRREAQTALDIFKPSLRAKILFERADTLEVREVECWESGDAKGIYFEGVES
jgi:hypothetical protein